MADFLFLFTIYRIRRNLDSRAFELAGHLYEKSAFVKPRNVALYFQLYYSSETRKGSSKKSSGENIRLRIKIKLW